MTGWIAQLCDHVGIEASYWGFDGAQVPASLDAQIALLKLMGHDASSEARAQDILQALRDEEAARPAPIEAVVFVGEATRIAVKRPVEWRLEAEDTTTTLASGAALAQIDLPGLPMGIHRLTLTEGPRDWTAWILARPRQAVSLADVTGGAKVWGVTAPIYSLTDGNSGSIGSYRSLADYATEIAAHGADFIGINPVHAMGHTRPNDVISPYSPGHREFLNTWHVALPANDLASGQGRDADAHLIDYPTALRASQNALANEFLNSGDASDYHRFQHAQGGSLETYALFEVLADNFGPDWRDWPAAYGNRDAAALAAFSVGNRQAISLYKWSQWRADQELEEAQRRSKNAGMRLGLYLDLAVGPRQGSAETWCEDSCLVTGASLGAPPDALAPKGQRWGLAPMSPHLCRAQGYSGFARLLRSVMRHAGMIRIDHVLGLMRSYWIPEGAHDGAYVSYPFDALLAIVAIESARSGVIVIGEDLGLVPDGLRQKLAVSGIYGLDVMQYMRDASGGFQDMQAARSKAICTFATHDTPTIEGFFAGEDVKLQLDLGIIERETSDQIFCDRKRAVGALHGQPAEPEIHGRLAKARSEIVAVQLDDIAHQLTQQNVPGTVDEYPNWRQVSSLALDDVRTSHTFTRLGDDMRAHGRANPRKNGDGKWHS